MIIGQKTHLLFNWPESFLPDGLNLQMPNICISKHFFYVFLLPSFLLFEPLKRSCGLLQYSPSIYHSLLNCCLPPSIVVKGHFSNYKIVNLIGSQDPLQALIVMEVLIGGERGGGQGRGGCFHSTPIRAGMSWYMFNCNYNLFAV